MSAARRIAVAQMSTPAEPAAKRRRPALDWRSQFGRPRGTLGRLVGRLMAVKNAEMHRLAVEQLDPQQGDRILEIGFGHGRMLGRFVARGAHVAGIDPSSVMVSQAARHLRTAIADGRAELCLGTVSELPWSDGSFTAVCAANSYQHWADPDGDLVEVQRVLEPGGRLLLLLRMHEPAAGPFSSPGFREHGVDGVQRALERTGYREVTRTRHELGRTVTCLSGLR
jgi:SAM-dependent methyltransferase